jgi:hypothetical protein
LVEDSIEHQLHEHVIMFAKMWKMSPRGDHPWVNSCYVVRGDSYIPMVVRLMSLILKLSLHIAKSPTFFLFFYVFVGGWGPQIEN